MFESCLANEPFKVQGRILLEWLKDGADWLFGLLA